MTAILRNLRFRAARTKLRNCVLRYRHRGLRPNDVFIGSFPRSGTYWLRFMLFEILTGKSPEFGLVDETLPWVGEHHKALPILPGGGRLINSHERYRSVYKKAIYLVRDVRDVVLSVYAREKEMALFGYPALDDFDSYLVPFLQGQTTPFGSWQDHVRCWLDSPMAKNGNLLTVRYEDMQRDPEQTLSQVLRFLDVSADPETIRVVVENNSIEKMRAKEDGSRTLPKATLEEGRFVRHGRIGGWRSRLSAPQVQLIEKYARGMLARVGYDTVAVREGISGTSRRAEAVGR